MNELSSSNSNSDGNAPQIFDFEGAPVRVVLIDGEPWWVLRDVCGTLSLSEPHRVADRLDEDDRTTSTVIDAVGRAQTTTLINESGLYSVILTSRKPEAKKFKKWVTGTVLPSIRKTGSYSVAQRELTRKEILQMALESETRCEELERQIEDLSPKARFYDRCCRTEGLVTVGAAAKELLLRDLDGNIIGEMGLYDWLRGWCRALCYGERGLYNMPYQRQIGTGRFRVIIDHAGRDVTMVTRKGLAWIEERWAAYLEEERGKRKREVELQSMHFDIDELLRSALN